MNWRIIPHNCYVFFFRQWYYKIKFGETAGSATILSLLVLVNKNFLKWFLLDQIYRCNLVSASKSFHFLKFLMLSCKVNLTHETLKLPSYRNQSNDLQSNQLTGFFMMATLAFNELIVKSIHKTLTFPLNLFTIIALFPFKWIMVDSFFQ